MEVSLSQLNAITSNDVEVISRITNNIGKEYLPAFIRVSRIPKLVLVKKKTN